MTYSIQPNMIPMRDIKQFSDGDRLFYELGRKLDPEGGYGDNWIRTGQFQEIENPKDFLWSDKLLSKVEYLEHHNFMLIKRNTEMEKEFVPYDLALRLKALGFNEPCFGFYKEFVGKWLIMMPTQLTQHEQNNLISYIEDGWLVSAPTFSQAFRWFREKYNLKSYIRFRTEKNTNKEHYDWVIEGQKVIYRHFKTYEAAEIACIRRLIRIVKESNK